MEGTQSVSYIFIYALPRVFREATGKQGFRETFRGASVTAVPASTKVLELTSLAKLFLGVLIVADLGLSTSNLWGI